jgi:ribonuclease Z
MTLPVKVTFLGTSDAIPSASRNHPAFLLTYRDENILVDCGEGTQRQFRKAAINPCKVTKLLITHWHGDHILGIPGFLQTLAFSGYNKSLEIYGPVGTKKFISEIIKIFAFSGEIDLKVHEVSDGKFFENELFYLECKEMVHGAPCNAYNFVIKEQIRIDKKKLSKLKIKAGSHLRDLKENKKINYNGKKYSANDLTYIEPGKKVSFVMDTKNNQKIIPFVKDADLFIIEGTYDAESVDLASEHKHMTCAQDAEIAKKAKVKLVALTHVSQRYSSNPHKLLNESKKIFKNIILPKDLDIVSV